MKNKYNLHRLKLECVVLFVLQLLQTRFEGLELDNELKELLFTILEDVNADIAQRAMAFTLLGKTTNQETLFRLIERMTSTDEKEQMIAYMKSCVRTLTESDNKPEAGYVMCVML